MQPGDNNGWHEWSKHVLIELKRLDQDIKGVDKLLRDISLEIAMLKIKSGIWGAMAGMVPVIIMLVVQMFSK